MCDAQLEEIDLKDDSIQVKEEEEEEGTDRVEILEPFGHTFLCTICGKNHSKNFSCVNYSVFKTEAYLCFNQECGKIFEREIELEQHAVSCQVTSDATLNETEIIQDEDFYLSRPSLKHCYSCRKKFKTKVLYLQHMRSFHPALIKCSVSSCNKFFKKQNDFEEHRLKKHKNSVSCAICGKDYKSKTSVQLHILIQHLIAKKQKPKLSISVALSRSVVEKAKCPYCCKFYYDVTSHVSNNHRDKTVKCSQPNCRRHFLLGDSSQSATPPLNRTAATGEDLSLLRPFLKYCNDCQMNFKNKVLYLQHMSIFHPELIKCSLHGCNKFFRKQTAFEEHRTKDHKDFVFCAICGNRYGSKLSVQSHILKQHLQQKKKEPSIKRSALETTECSFCRKFFKHIKAHVTKYHPERIVKCSNPSCRKDFLSEEEKQAHVQEKHFPKSCDICHRNFSTNYSLQKHIFNQHTNKKIVRKSGTTECIHCGQFVKSIVSHVRNCHSDKLLVCTQDDCTKRFVTESDLLDHVQKIHCPIKCIYCLKEFENSFVYIRHVQRHHTGKGGIKCSFKKCAHYFKCHPEMEIHYMENHPFQAKCDLCGYLATSLEKILHHMETKHHPNFERETLSKGGKTECSFCGKFVKDVANHLKLKHHGKMFQNSQTNCCKNFETEESLQNHRIQAHGAIKCTFCDLVFDHTYLYIDHVYSWHQGRKLFKCFSKAGCAHYFKSQVEMEKHHTENHPFQAKCDLCGHLAPTLTHILQHMENKHYPNFKKINFAQNFSELDVALPQHTSKDRFCTFCLKEIPSKVQWRTHKNPMCLICRKSFPCRGLMPHHTCLFQCRLCKKQFEHSFELKRHIVLGCGRWRGKEYKTLGLKCVECRKYYCSKFAFELHFLLVHSKNTRLRCDLCTKTFSDKQGIRRHIMQVHKFGAD